MLLRKPSSFMVKVCNASKRMLWEEWPACLTEDKLFGGLYCAWLVILCRIRREYQGGIVYFVES